MKVVIIGTGNVAMILGRKIASSGNKIIQIVGRNEEAVRTISSFFNCGYSCNMLEINFSADIFIIAVSDSAITEIAGLLKLNDKLVVHTAASVSQDVLDNCSTNYGVLYPLQTLKKEVEEVPPIPVLINGNNEISKSNIYEFARNVFDGVSFATDEERMKYHVAAIFANNFTNYLFTLSSDFCNINRLEFKFLEPIIKETIGRLGKYLPGEVQTGPAVRNDLQTVEKHRQLIKSGSKNPFVLSAYDFMTSQIQEYYKVQKMED